MGMTKPNSIVTRFHSLDRYRKSVLLILPAMVLLFSVIYPMTIARKGFLYQDTIFIPSLENGNTVYAAKLHGEQARFTVSPDKTVNFQYGEKKYGPYTFEEDPTAIPQNDPGKDQMTGVELRLEDQVLFRGGVMNIDGHRFLVDEDGDVADISLSMMTSDGSVYDEDGQVIDPMKPSMTTLLELMDGPKLTHKGEIAMWFLGVFVCIFTGASILFADEIFRFNLWFQIREPEKAEPSDWEIAGRYISWAVLPLTALIIFVLGLR